MRYCICSREPDENCPIHGYSRENRCACGKFVKTKKRKSCKKSKKYKFITGWMGFNIAKQHQEEHIIAYVSHVYLRRKDVPSIWCNKQKIILKVKK